MARQKVLHHIWQDADGPELRLQVERDLVEVTLRKTLTTPAVFRDLCASCSYFFLTIHCFGFIAKLRYMHSLLTTNYSLELVRKS